MLLSLGLSNTRTTITCFSIFVRGLASQSHHRGNLKQDPSASQFPYGSPSRVHKLIASQSDPLLAKEIFDCAYHHSNFPPPYSSYLCLIIKLARSKHFSLIDDLLIRLKAERYPVTPILFSSLIKAYADADLPDKAVKAFYTMLEFNCKPLPKHLNRILEILVSHQSYIRPGFDLFRSAQKYGVSPNAKSYNIMMRAFCLNGDLSIAYSLFNQMIKREVFPNVESYRILMQGLCRKSQVSTAVDLLEDMLNKGFVPDALCYTTLLNSLCRKKKLREAYKLLCRMKVKGCNPDIIHYNTVIAGFCREGRALDACKILKDMPSNGCLPNLVSYHSLISGLCDQGMYDEAKNYLLEMISKDFSPHFSVLHSLIKGFCSVGKLEEAYLVVGQLLKHGSALHCNTWSLIVPLICEENEKINLEDTIANIIKLEITRDTRIIDVAVNLGECIMRDLRDKPSMS